MDLSTKKKHIITGLVLFFTAMVVSSIGIANTHNWGGDFSQYIAQAKAIFDGDVREWFARNSFTIEHSMDGLGALSYPWLTSILIVPIYAVWGLNFIPYQIFMSACFATSVAAFYILMIRRRVKASVILLICSAIIINSNYLMLTKNVLSDIPCMMFTVIAWLFIDIYLETRSIKKGILVGVFVFLAVAARTMALTLFVALGIIDLVFFVKKMLSRRLSFKQFAIMCIPYGVFFALFIILSLALPRGESTYLGFFTLDIKHLISNDDYYHDLLILMLSQNIQALSGMPEFFAKLTSVVTTCLSKLMIPLYIALLIGFIRRIEEMDHLPIYLVVMHLMLCVYDYQQGTRFIITLFPIVLLLAYYGIITTKDLILGISEKNNRHLLFREILLKGFTCDIMFVIALSIVFGGIHVIAGDTRSPSKDVAVNSDSALATYSYIRNNLGEDDVVLFFKPRVLCLYTNVHSYINDITLPESIIDADYLLYYIGYSKFDDYILNHQDSLIAQYSNDQFTLYKIDKKVTGENNNE